MADPTLDQCRSKAYEIYNKTLTGPAYLLYDQNFKPVFKGSNYWQIGCIFDSLIDYLRQDASFPTRKVTEQQVQKFMSDSYDFYQKLVTDRCNYSWYDDFAWWGIACSKAFDTSYDVVFGNLKGRYQQISLATWETVKNGKCDHVHFGAPNVWEHCDQDLFSVCKPKFEGGVWQYDIFGDVRLYEDSSANPSTPIDLTARVVEYDSCTQGKQKINIPDSGAQTLGPFQLTVVNGLYFVLANRLAAFGFEDQKTADAVFQFFKSWLEVSNPQPLFQAVGGGKLIRERVSAYYDGTAVNGWNADTSWGGDQGLVLGALADYKRYFKDPSRIQWIDPWLTQIMGGVSGSMKGTTTDGVTFLMPWFPTDGNWFESTDANDYSSGIGVYMRYLNYAYGFDQVVQNYVNHAFGSMHNLILSSAATVLAGELPKWKSSWSKDYPFDYFNQLAIMVMAISLLKPKS